MYRYFLHCDVNVIITVMYGAALVVVLGGQVTSMESVVSIASKTAACHLYLEARVAAQTADIMEGRIKAWTSCADARQGP